VEFSSLRRINLDVHSSDLSPHLFLLFFGPLAVGCLLLTRFLERCKFRHLPFNPLVKKKRRVGIGSETLFAVFVELIQESQIGGRLSLSAQSKQGGRCFRGIKQTGSEEVFAVPGFAGRQAEALSYDLRGGFRAKVTLQSGQFAVHLVHSRAQSINVGVACFSLPK